MAPTMESSNDAILHDNTWIGHSAPMGEVSIPNHGGCQAGSYDFQDWFAAVNSMNKS
jgi:hypothetical protein